MSKIPSRSRFDGSDSLALPAPAKLNLTLKIVGRRDDGMHLLRGTMALADFCDTVFLTARQDGQITRDWRHAQVSEAADLTMRAAAALKQAAGKSAATQGVTIRVQKKIPVGGGLGGGSSDAATVLRGLNILWRLGWKTPQLAALAAKLGADVPFFLHGAPSEISGVGDRYASCGGGDSKKMLEKSYLLVFPPVAALTAAVYQEYAKLTSAQKAAPLPPPWDKCANDLTAAAVKLHPALTKTAQFLYNIAGEAKLSGSGSTIFAAFASAAQAQKAKQQLPPEMRAAAHAVSLLARHPMESL